MFSKSNSSAIAGQRLGRFALALASMGLTFLSAQQRVHPQRQTPVDRPVQSQPAYRPAPSRSMDSPPVRVPSERPAQGKVVRNPSREGTPVRPATNAIITPRPLERCTTRPTPEVWQRRDIMAEIQSMARSGHIVVHPIGEDVKEFTGVSDFPAGWKAYGFRVPPGESIHIRLHHGNEGWFRLGMVNKWGGLEKGMLQNLIPTGNPEVKYDNPTSEARSVYVIVDDPGWMSSETNPFSMKGTRSWDPAKKKVDDAQVVTGIWAQKKEEPKPNAVKTEVPAVVSPQS